MARSTSYSHPIASKVFERRNIVERYKKPASGRPAISTAEYQALAEFRYQIRVFLRFSEQAARAARIEPQQHQLLLSVKNLNSRGWPTTVRAVAERLQIQHHSAVELIDRTERRGLVKRQRRSEDRRQVEVELTPRGERMLRELTVHHRAALSEAGPALVKALETLLAAPPAVE